MRSRETRPAYSYRSDPSVPDFDDSAPVAVMDGECVMCTFGARRIARHDRSGDIRICWAQSKLGRALLSHYDIDADDPDSWIYLADGRAHTSADGIIRIGRRLGGCFHALQALRVFPRPVQDWLYRRVARNRHRLFGRQEVCAVPDADLRGRLIE